MMSKAILTHLSCHDAQKALLLFGAPEKVTAFASSARGQLPENVDDDFVVHLQYPTTAPLPPDSEAPAPGTRLAGPRVTLGASCLSAHVDAEQPRFRVEGTRGSVSLYLCNRSNMMAFVRADSKIGRAHV